MEILYLIITLLITWIGGFLLHELFHKWCAQKQGIEAHIVIWFHHKIPSMKCVTVGSLPNRLLYLLAGGLGAGVILLLLSLPFLHLWYVFTPLFGVGLINLTYSFYEMLFRDVLTLNEYMKYHYYIYILVGLLSLIISYFIYFY